MAPPRGARGPPWASPGWPSFSPLHRYYPTRLPRNESLLIERFDATVQVEESGWIEVREEIRVRFQGTWNGMFRLIPTEYRTPQGFSYRLWLDDLSVTGPDGEQYEYRVSRERHYRKLRIRVPGASDAVRTVVIRYRVPNGLKYWDEYEELYWNVTGHEWEMPIRVATARIVLPGNLDGLRTASWTGGYGAAENGASVTELEDGFYFESVRPLSYREGLTVAVAWNPGVVSRPGPLSNLRLFFKANWLLLLPFISLGVMWRLWSAPGRDPTKRPISPRYDVPDGLTPAEAGTLIDNRSDMRDITAGFVDLAVRGYVKIEEVEKQGFAKWFGKNDFRIVRLRDASTWDDLKGHERETLRGIFGSAESTLLSELQHEFYEHLPQIQTDIYSELMQRHYYHHRPDKTKGFYTVFGLTVLVISLALGIPLARWLQAPMATVVITVVGCALPVLLFGLIMPARTVRGTRVLERVLGFEEFLDRVESDRSERMVKTPEMFEEFLPYAMAFGVEKKWAAAFESLYTEPPDRYSGTWDGRFRTIHLVDSMSVMSSTART